jgi:hypothetical protein
MIETGFRWTSQPSTSESNWSSMERRQNPPKKTLTRTESNRALGKVAALDFYSLQLRGAFRTSDFSTERAMSSSISLISRASFVFPGNFRYCAKSLSRLTFSASRLAFSVCAVSSTLWNLYERLYAQRFRNVIGTTKYAKALGRLNSHFQ